MSTMLINVHALEKVRSDNLCLRVSVNLISLIFFLISIFFHIFYNMSINFTNLRKYCDRLICESF